ncbi:MAG: nuclear transport factor 2 family protein [Streptomycetaceae bacterium]|jgi:ketosteroid isomerase-like protein|nr:nuclear transport factor 2 family protein [Streptomycetaceae bacterium]
MAEHADSAMVRRGYEAFSAGDMQTLGAMMTGDVTHHVPGDHPLSGHMKGLDNVLGYYGRLFSETDGTVRVTLEQVFADGRGHAISVHRFTATRKGRSIDQRGGLFFTIVGGKITDIDECSPDIDEANEFWS